VLALGLVAAGVGVTAAGLGWAVLMGAGTTAFAYVAWYACQRALSGTSAGTVQLAIPILTAVAAFALLGEALTTGLAVSAPSALRGCCWPAVRCVMSPATDHLRSTGDLSASGGSQSPVHLHALQRRILDTGALVRSGQSAFAR